MPLPKHRSELMGNPWAWQLIVTSLHGLHRGSPGSHQEWVRAGSRAESTESSGTERIGSSVMCEHPAVVEGAAGEGVEELFFFICSKTCVFSFLSSPASHLCRFTPLWHVFADHNKEKVWEDCLKALVNLRPSCTQNPTGLAAAGFFWLCLHVFYTVKSHWQSLLWGSVKSFWVLLTAVLPPE